MVDSGNNFPLTSSQHGWNYLERNFSLPARTKGVQLLLQANACCMLTLRCWALAATNLNSLHVVCKVKVSEGGQ